MKHQVIGITLAAAALMLRPSTSAAQAPAADLRTPAAAADTAPVCYGFTFGAWTPALDRAAAGHDQIGLAGPAAPGGRSWAAADSSSGSSLILFPGWWPAGVRVMLPSGPPPVGRSATGTAVAMVADARKRAPAAPIVVYGVPCDRR